VNAARNAAVFHRAGDNWTPTDWGCAIAGEVGEACNLVKKLRRGEPIERAAVANELADAVIYIDLLAADLGIDLGQAIAHKWNVVARRRGYQVRIAPEPGTPCPLGTLAPQSTPEGS
jgi:NTP pyrophosphatase (non-canonical NTP hydrolase)